MSTKHDILVIDDRTLDAQETLVALEQIAPRATVLHLQSGNEAVEYLFSVGAFAGRAPIMPQLVLLSAETSDISGLCLLDLMRAHPLTRAVPIVLLSCESDLRQYRRQDQFGADAYVLKPRDFQRYCSLLQGCLECWIPSALRPGASYYSQLLAQQQSSLSSRPHPDGHRI